MPVCRLIDLVDLASKGERENWHVRLLILRLVWFVWEADFLILSMPLSQNEILTLERRDWHEWERDFYACLFFSSESEERTSVQETKVLSFLWILNAKQQYCNTSRECSSSHRRLFESMVASGTKSQTQQKHSLRMVRSHFPSLSNTTSCPEITWTTIYSLQADWQHKSHHPSTKNMAWYTTTSGLISLSHPERDVGEKSVQSSLRHHFFPPFKSQRVDCDNSHDHLDVLPIHFHLPFRVMSTNCVSMWKGDENHDPDITRKGEGDKLCL